MKKNLFLVFVLALGALISFNACDSDPCEKKDCVNGTCFEGDCECDAGYEYDADGACTVVSRDKFIANFTVNETCTNSGTAPAYLVTISAGASITDVKILGFYGPVASGGFQLPVNATIEGNVIKIARQQPDNDKIYVEGQGTIDASVTPNKITVSYKVTDETGSTIVTNQCDNVIFTKQ